MICGTASDVGKSHLVTGLCRHLARRGVRVAPFKAQNMALNSFVTAGGSEIGRAQAVQAMAAGVEPEGIMNPVLLKPLDEHRSQVMVLGRAIGDLDYATYRSRHQWLRQVVHDSLSELRRRFDVVICEGAGGSAEINLLEADLVNLPLASDAGIRAIIVGDIERGGVFASLFGTVSLLPEHYRDLIGGFVINKFRGDRSLLDPGTAELTRRTGVPTLGIVPWIDGLCLDAEDSLGLVPSLSNAPPRELGRAMLDIAVLRLPHISNFTDLDPLTLEANVDLRMVSSRSIGDPDLLIIPGTKATVADLNWVRATGLDQAIIGSAARPGGPVVLGICGGYQMLGRIIDDEVESRSGRQAGLGLLEITTTFETTKVTKRRCGTALGHPVNGYEIHHGRIQRDAQVAAWVELDENTLPGTESEGAVSASGDVLGTSVHGLMESDGFRATFLARVAERRGKHFTPSRRSFAAARQSQFDRLADAIESSVDLGALERLVCSAIPLAE